MGKDRRKEKEEVDEALGKKQDKYGKKGDGKKDTSAAAPAEKRCDAFALAAPDLPAHMPRAAPPRH